MIITLCDGCQKDLKDTIYAKVRVRGRELDLCKSRNEPNDGGCLKFFPDYERQVDDLADKTDKDIDAKHAEIEAHFWEQVRRGR